MNNPTARVSGRKVLASGTVVVAPDETLEVAVDLGGSEFRLRVSFTTQDNAGYKAEGAADVDGFTLRMYNFNNPIGIAPLQAMQLPTAAGRPVFLSYAVHSIGSDKAATRLFSYTISAAEQA